jgi:PAS domain S-box-containing protein
MQERLTYKDLHQKVKQLEFESIARKQAEDAFVLIEKKFRSLFENSLMGLFQTAFNGRLIEANPALARILGYESREDLFAAISDFKQQCYVNPRQREEFIQSLHAKGQLIGFETQFYRKDGKIIWISESARVEYDEKGNVVYYDECLDDISVRKQNENISSILFRISNAVSTTRDLNELFLSIHTILKDVVDATNFYIALIDEPEDRLVFPYFADEVDQNYLASITNIYSPNTKGYTAEVIRRGQPMFITDEVSQKLGLQGEGVPSKVWLGVPLKIKEKIIGAMAIQHYTNKYHYTEEDIHVMISVSEQVALAIERKMNEEALTESEAKYRTILENIEDGYYEVDAAGQFTFFNEATLKILGYTREELLKKNAREVVDETNYKIILQANKKVARTNKAIKGVEVTLLRKDGFPCPLEISISLIKDSKNQILGFRGIARDITERKRAEEEHKKLQAQLLHAQKLESIGIIASGVAHNFRNILAGITANNNLLQLKARDNPELLEITQRVLNAIKRGAQLVDGLVQFSRKGSAEDLKIVDLSEVVHETYDLISKSFDKKIEIHLNLENSLYVKGDYSALNQVIMNLCTNARDAMPGGGTLTIAMKRKGPRAEISIRDTGQGMTPEVRRKCFDPFFTTKEVGKGTGLGLSTSYGIIKAHQGDIHVYSELGQGTSFKIFLPLVTTNGEEGVSADSQLVFGQGQKILIVDDEADMQRPMEEILISLGYQAAAVSSAKEGLAKYRAWHPQVVLMDRNMPEMDGIICTEEIIKSDPEAKIILISGYDEVGINGIDPAVKQMIAGYITKPIDMVELSLILSRLFNGFSSDI